MVETTLAAADLITAIPSLWQDLRVPLAILALIGGCGAGIFTIFRGFGAAMGKVIGGISIAAITLGAWGLANSLEGTVNTHTGGVFVGQFGR